MTIPPLSEEERRELVRLATIATGDGKQAGDWYAVESPWLPSDAETYIVAGSPDPHAGLYVCDFVTVDVAGMEHEWSDDEWTSRNWALAAFIAAANPQTILRYEATLAALSKRVEEAERSAAAWEESAKLFATNEAFWHDLVDQTGRILGGRVYVQDDGGVVTEPLGLRVPEVAAETKARAEAAEQRVAELEAQVGVLTEALIKEVVYMEHDCPGDAPEPCGLECRICPGLSEGGETIEAFVHHKDCILAPCPIRQPKAQPTSAPQESPEP